jgi:hypothetical protein
MKQEKPIKNLQALAILLLCFPFALHAATGDDFIRGYASAVLEREFRLRNFSVNVAGEAVTVTSGELVEADRDKVIAALASIDGIERVVVLDSRGVEVARSTPQASAIRSASLQQSVKPEYELGFLPGGNLFEPDRASRSVTDIVPMKRQKWPLRPLVKPLLFTMSAALTDCGRSAFRPVYFRSLTWIRHRLIWLTATFSPGCTRRTG